MQRLAQGAALNTSPGKGTSQGSSLTLSFNVSFLWEVCPVPFPPQGERRVVWPSLGKFLRRPTLSWGSHVAPFPPSASIQADSGEPSAPASAPFSAHVWKHPQLTRTCSGGSTQGWGQTGTTLQLASRCAREAKPGRRQMKSRPAMGWRPRKRRLQPPDANLACPPFPR